MKIHKGITYSKKNLGNYVEDFNHHHYLFIAFFPIFWPTLQFCNFQMIRALQNLDKLVMVKM